MNVLSPPSGAGESALQLALVWLGMVSSGVRAEEWCALGMRYWLRPITHFIPVG